ncbi:MAG: Hsp20 family protein, partial [Treponema sp.]|nr:Hsp20 family protein [Treponema sp.]
LPDDIDETKVTASFKNGVLNVTMARKALPEPKKIAIEVA